MDKSKYKYYVVIANKKRTVVNSWEECKKQLYNLNGAVFKGFDTLTEAKEFTTDDLIYRKNNNNDKNTLEVKKDINDSNKYIIYTDGSCLKNPNGAGGYASYIVNRDNNNRIISIFGGEASTTNNRMEIRALIEALLALSNINETLFLDIYSDSQYLINAFNQNWIRAWKRNNWQTSSGGKVKNIDLWKQLDKLINAENRKIQLIWCKGHIGNEFNELCDKLAKEEANKYVNNNNLDGKFRKIKIYTSSDFEKHKESIIQVEKKEKKMNKKLKSINKDFYSDNKYNISFKSNDEKLGELRFSYYKDNLAKEKPPVEVLEILVTKKDDNIFISRYTKVFFGEKYSHTSKSIFIKNFLKQPEIREDLLIEGANWTGIIDIENKKGINEHCFQYIKELNKMKNVSFKNMIKLKVGGKDTFSSKKGKTLLLNLLDDDIAKIKNEKFEEKDFETALRWLHRGLNIDLCIRKVKTDISVRNNTHPRSINH